MHDVHRNKLETLVELYAPALILREASVVFAAETEQRLFRIFRRCTPFLFHPIQLCDCCTQVCSSPHAHNTGSLGLIIRVRRWILPRAQDRCQKDFVFALLLSRKRTNTYKGSTPAHYCSKSVWVLRTCHVTTCIQII